VITVPKHENKRKHEKKRKRGVARDDMPSTIARSDEKAQRTWQETHDSAVDQYGEGERAHRTAFASLKHTYEKEGDRWVPKDEKGASDPRSEMSTEDARAGKGETYGGIDYYGHTKKEFEQRAKRLGITGYSRMRKAELVKRIEQRERSQAESRRRRKAA
jgi:cation transport regulator ChaB